MQVREFLNLLKTATDVDQIDAHRDAIAEILPLVRIMFDYDQRNSAHQYDLWFHSLHVVVGLPRELDDDMLYLAALLHDIGKPDSRCRGKRIDDMDMHYYGHPVKSMELVRDVVIPNFRDLCIEQGVAFGVDDYKRLLFYVEHHDDHMSLQEKTIRKYVDMGISWRVFQHLMFLEVSDALAHVQIPIIAERAEICRKLGTGQLSQGVSLWHSVVQ